MAGLLSIRGGKAPKPSSGPARLTLAALGGFVLMGLWLSIVARAQDNARASSPLEPCSTSSAIVARSHSITGTLHNHVITAASDPLCANADLSVAKTVNNAILDVGEAITYTVMVTNGGPDDATGVQVMDVLPEKVIFRSATPQDVCMEENNTITCDLGHLPNNDSAMMTIVVTPTMAGMITNVASVTSDASDPDQSNNMAEKVNRVTGADLVVTKTVNITAPKAGDRITYTIMVANNGPDEATEVQVIDVLPKVVPFDGWYTATRGTYITATGLWSVGNLVNAASATMTIAATVISCTGLTTIPNTASISADWPNDPNPDNNESRVVISPASGVYCLYLPIIFKNHCTPYIDTFIDPSSGWPITDNIALKTEYTDGEYRMLAKDPSLAHYAYQLPDYFTDYEIEVDAHWADSASTGEGYGIVFGLANDGSHAYVYLVNTDRQEYNLWRYLRDSNKPWNSLTGGWVHTDTIRSGLLTNRLKVIRSGSQITLYANSILTTIVNNEIESGRVGLSVLTYYDDPKYDSRNADVHFDNYILNLCVGTANSVHAESNLPVLAPFTGALPRPN
jgi:uncharacterized repeat protein (TIGR01451 family)